MEVIHVPCGPFVNDSEKKAFEAVKAYLMNLSGNRLWIIMSNIPVSFDDSYPSKEIDLLVIGHSGIHVIEVKHWQKYMFDQKMAVINKEAEKVNSCAKRVKSKIVRSLPNIELNFIEGKILITTQINKVIKKNTKIRGVSLFGLKDIEDLLVVNEAGWLDEKQIRDIALSIEKHVGAKVNKELTQIGDFDNLQKLHADKINFIRVFKATHQRTSQNLFLYLYDLTARDAEDNFEIARREYEIYTKLDGLKCAPKRIDSFQTLYDYPEEMYFFTVKDPIASTLNSIAIDDSWNFDQRLHFSAEAFSALHQIHTINDGDETIVHRNISPESVCVNSKNLPIFTNFRFAQHCNIVTISEKTQLYGLDTTHVAPEIIDYGISAASTSSDVFSLASTLLTIFANTDSETEKLIEILKNGMSNQPENRPTALKISEELRNLTSPAETKFYQSNPKYWDDHTELTFRSNRYRVVSKIGAGGIGIAFKVAQVNADDEEIGYFVAKVVSDQENADKILQSYNYARPCLDHSNLASILEITNEWESNQISVLMHWIPGKPVSSLKDELRALRNDTDELFSENSIAGWILGTCSGLSKLHQAGLVHGDISPGNLIFNGETIVITDYDATSKIGNSPSLSGTPGYMPDDLMTRKKVHPSDDIYALGKVFLELIDLGEAARVGVKNLTLGGIAIPVIEAFIKKATAERLEDRYQDGVQAFQDIQQAKVKKKIYQSNDGSSFVSTEPFTDSEIGHRKIWDALHDAFTGRDCRGQWRHPLGRQLHDKEEKSTDFVIIDRELGIIIIEVLPVKLENIHSINDGIWNYSNWIMSSSEPFSEVEDRSIPIMNQFDSNRNLRFALNCRLFIAIPFISNDEFNSKFPTAGKELSFNLLFLEDLMSPLLERIQKVNSAFGRTGRILDEKEWLCALSVFNGGSKSNKRCSDKVEHREIHKKITVTELIENRLMVLDKEQETTGKTIPPGVQRIRGIAGSGKTVIIAMKAAWMHLIHPEWDIAILFFTQSLYSSIQSTIEYYYKEFSNDPRDMPNYNKLHIWHTWGSKRLQGFYRFLCNHEKVRGRFLSFDKAKKEVKTADGTAPFAYACKHLLQNKSHVLERLNLFDSILIDEGQDFVNGSIKFEDMDPFYYLAYSVLKPVENGLKKTESTNQQELPQKRLIWAYDEYQNLSNTSAPTGKQLFNSNKILQGNHPGYFKKNIPMRICYRSPRRIITAAHFIGMGLKRDGSPIQLPTRKKQWEDLGYEVKGDFRKVGNRISISRPISNSNTFVEEDYYPSADLITFKTFNTKRLELDYISDCIRSDLEKSKLKPEHILIVIIGKKHYGQKLTAIAKLLRKLNIDYYYASMPRKNITYSENKNPEIYSLPGCVTIASVLRAKGNETYQVYIPNLEYIAHEESALSARNELFVGMTRSKAWLTMTATGSYNQPFFVEIEEVLKSKNKITFEYRKPMKESDDDE